MDRRKFMIGAGSVGIATIGGAAIMSSAAAQEVDTGVFDIGDIHEDSHSGRLSSLELTNIEVTVEWEGFNAPAEEAEWTLYAEHPDQGEEEIGSTSESLGGDEYAGSEDGSIDTVDLVDIFGDGAFEASPHPDGAEYADHTESWEVSFRLVAEVEQTGGDTFEDEATGESLTEVTNLETNVDTGGEAEIESEEASGDEYVSGVEIPLSPFEGDPSQEQYDQLMNMELSDPFTVHVYRNDEEGDVDQEVAVIDHLDSFDETPQDRLSGSTEIQYDDGWGSFTIGESGSGADLETGLTGTPVNDIGTIEIEDADRTGVE